MFNEDEDEDEITYKESPFKSIIADIRNKLSKNRDILVKKGLYYVEEMKEFAESKVNDIKEKLIKFKNELIRKNKINNGIKKNLNNYNGIKDIRYLFSGYEDVDEDKESPFKSIIVDIRNKLSKNGDKLIKKGLYYVEEMKSLGSAEIKNIKEKLIIFKNELIRKNKINNRIKKDLGN